jgi:acetolactate synthase-1/2/3 large subunit
MARMSGGEAMARILKAAGTEYIFGIAVGSQAPFIMAAIEQGIGIVTVRDEKSAALMATSYGRVSGKPGICLASSPGAAHLALGMYEAFNASNAIVAITGDAGSNARWRPGSTYMNQETLFRPITKWTVCVDSLDTLPGIMHRALRVATTGSPGPVSIIVANSLFAAQGDFQIPERAATVHYPALRVPPGQDVIEAAASLLLEAQKPAIIAGGGVALSQASGELLALAELLGIPVATTHMAHGSFPSAHPLSAGVLGSAVAGNRGLIANGVVSDADVVLVIGSRLDARTTLSHTLIAPGAKLVQIDIDPDEIGSNYPVQVGMAADAKRALIALTHALESRVTRPSSIARTPRAQEIAAMVEECKQEFAPQVNADTTPIKTPRLMREIQPFINNETIVVVDAGACSYWAPAYLDLTPANQALYPRGAAALGSSLPMALGAQLANPHKRVICLSGDGAYGYNIMELETAVRMNLPVVSIVINNGILGMERRGYLAYAGKVPEAAVSFSPQDFSKIAQAYNCFGVRVEKPQDLHDAIAAALASGRPAIVDVVTDPVDSDSDRTRPWRSY